jgi:hypothetical protein
MRGEAAFPTRSPDAQQPFGPGRGSDMKSPEYPEARGRVPKRDLSRLGSRPIGYAFLSRKELSLTGSHHIKDSFFPPHKKHVAPPDNNERPGKSGVHAEDGRAIDGR